MSQKKIENIENIPKPKTTAIVAACGAICGIISPILVLGLKKHQGKIYYARPTSVYQLRPQFKKEDISILKNFPSTHVRDPGLQKKFYGTVLKEDQIPSFFQHLRAQGISLFEGARFISRMPPIETAFKDFKPEFIPWEEEQKKNIITIGRGFQFPESSLMLSEEARNILSIGEGEDRGKIKKRMNAMLRINHPDSGGSDFLASKILQAKAILENPGLKEEADRELRQFVPENDDALLGTESPDNFAEREEKEWLERFDSSTIPYDFDKMQTILRNVADFPQLKGKLPTTLFESGSSDFIRKMIKEPSSDPKVRLFEEYRRIFFESFWTELPQKLSIWYTKEFLPYKQTMIKKEDPGQIPQQTLDAAYKIFNSAWNSVTQPDQQFSYNTLIQSLREEQYNPESDIYMRPSDSSEVNEPLDFEDAFRNLLASRLSKVYHPDRQYYYQQMWKKQMRKFNPYVRKLKEQGLLKEFVPLDKFTPPPNDPFESHIPRATVDPQSGYKEQTIENSQFPIAFTYYLAAKKSMQSFVQNLKIYAHHLPSDLSGLFFDELKETFAKLSFDLFLWYTKYQIIWEAMPKSPFDSRFYQIRSFLKLAFLETSFYSFVRSRRSAVDPELEKDFEKFRLREEEAMRFEKQMISQVDAYVKEADKAINETNQLTPLNKPLHVLNVLLENENLDQVRVRNPLEAEMRTVIEKAKFIRLQKQPNAPYGPYFRPSIFKIKHRKKQQEEELKNLETLVKRFPGSVSNRILATRLKRYPKDTLPYSQNKMEASDIYPMAPKTTIVDKIKNYFAPAPLFVLPDMRPPSDPQYDTFKNHHELIRKMVQDSDDPDLKFKMHLLDKRLESYLQHLENPEIEQFLFESHKPKINFSYVTPIKADLSELIHPDIVKQLHLDSKIPLLGDLKPFGKFPINEVVFYRVQLMTLFEMFRSDHMRQFKEYIDKIPEEPEETPDPRIPRYRINTIIDHLIKQPVLMELDRNQKYKLTGRKELLPHFKEIEVYSLKSAASKRAEILREIQREFSSTPSNRQENKPLPEKSMEFFESEKTFNQISSASTSENPEETEIETDPKVREQLLAMIRKEQEDLLLWNDELEENFSKLKEDTIKFEADQAHDMEELDHEIRLFSELATGDFEKNFEDFWQKGISEATEKHFEDEFENFKSQVNPDDIPSREFSVLDHTVSEQDRETFTSDKWTEFVGDHLDPEEEEFKKELDADSFLPPKPKPKYEQLPSNDPSIEEDKYQATQGSDFVIEEPDEPEKPRTDNQDKWWSS